MVKSAKQLAKQFFGTGPVGGVSEEKPSTGNPDTKLEGMDWEVQFDRKFRTHGYYLFSRSDEFCNADSARAIKDFIREAISTAVKEENERWMNQPANEHDARIRADERERIRNAVLKLDFAQDESVMSKDMVYLDELLPIIQQPK